MTKTGTTQNPDHRHGAIPNALQEKHVAKLLFLSALWSEKEVKKKEGKTARDAKSREF